MIDIAPLRSLREDFGLPREYVTERDVKEEYRATGSFSLDVLQHISADRLDILGDTFGSAISLRVPSNDLCPDLISEGTTHNDADSWIERLKNDSSLNLELVIRKGPLQQGIGFDSSIAQVRLYFFDWGLQEALSKGICSLDGGLFEDPEERHLLIVTDNSIHLSGPLLAVAGQEYLSDIRELWDGTGERNRQRLQLYRSARDHINWLNFNLNHVTPLHFLCTDRLSESDGFTESVQQILCSHLFQLGILYTANRSEQVNGGTFRSTYESSERTATLHVESECKEYPDAEHLVRFVRWPFGGEHSDRLMILQNVIARSLRGRDEHEAVMSLSNQLADVLREAQWHFRTFIDDRIDQHFDRVERATTFANNVAREIEQRISSMTKGLTDALLGAIGVVLGALLGTLVEGGTDDRLLKYGMIAYSVYLVGFHGLYRMWSVYDGFRILEQDTENRKAEFETQLSGSRYENIVGVLDRRVDQFKRWFCITVVLYAIVSLGLLIGAFQIPELILQSG